MSLAGLLFGESIVCAAINVLAATPCAAETRCERIRTACKTPALSRVADREPARYRLLDPLVFGKQPKRASRPLPQITRQLAAACKKKVFARRSPEANTR